MEQHEQDMKLLDFARRLSGGYRKLALRIGANSGALCQMWVKNGVPHKWRLVLQYHFGDAYKAVQKAESKNKSAPAPSPSPAPAPAKKKTKEVKDINALIEEQKKILAELAKK